MDEPVIDRCVALRRRPVHRWHERVNYELLFVPHAICVVGVGLDDLADLLDALRLVEEDRSYHLFPASFIRELRRQKRATELHDPTLKHPVHAFEVFPANGKAVIKPPWTRIIWGINTEEVLRWGTGHLSDKLTRLWP